MSENEPEHPTEPPRSDRHDLAPAGPAADGSTSGPGGQSKDERRVSDRKDILFKLDQMPGWVALGLLSTARANSMRGIYQTMLANLNDAAPEGAAAIANEDLLAVLRTQPGLLKALKPFLTPEQLDLIVREAANEL